MGTGASTLTPGALIPGSNKHDRTEGGPPGGPRVYTCPLVLTWGVHPTVTHFLSMYLHTCAIAGRTTPYTRCRVKFLSKEARSKVMLKNLDPRERGHRCPYCPGQADGFLES